MNNKADIPYTEGDLIRVTSRIAALTPGTIARVVAVDASDRTVCIIINAMPIWISWSNIEQAANRKSLEDAINCAWQHYRTQDHYDPGYPVKPSENFIAGFIAGIAEASKKNNPNLILNN